MITEGATQGSPGVGRRDFLRRSGMFALGASAAPLLASCGGSGQASNTLTVWWNKGYYPSEDEAIRQVAKQFQKKTGITVDLQIYGTQDIVRKVESAITAGNVPDVVYAQKPPTAQYAWEGKLADVSEVVKSADLAQGPKQSASLYNSEAGKVSNYAVPLHQFTVSLFHWRSMLEDVGMSYADAPSDWGGYWQFWKEAQQKHRSRGNKVRSIAWPMGSAAGDTNYDTQQVLRAYGVELLDEKNQLRTTRGVRQGITDALTWITDLYKGGYAPKSTVNWQDSSNNTYFLNRSALITPNGSLSIPGAVKDKNKQKWKDIVTTSFPSRPIGGDTPAQSLIHHMVVFKESPNPDKAIDFLKFIMQPDNSLTLLKGAKARWFPVHSQLLTHPFFAESDDPNIQAVAKQLQGPTVANWEDVHPAYDRAEALHVWGNTLGRIVLQGQTPEQGADYALSELQSQFEQYQR